MKLRGTEFVNPGLGARAEGAWLGFADSFSIVEERGRSLTFLAVEFRDIVGLLNVP